MSIRPPTRPLQPRRAAAFALALALPLSAPAAVIGTYTFDHFDPIGDLRFPLAPNVSFTSLSRVGLKPVYVPDQFASTGYSESDAMDPGGSYVEFTLTAAPDANLSLQSISFTHLRTGVDTALSGPQYGEVRASFESFAPGSGTGSVFSTETFPVASTWDFTDYTSPLGGSATFRIYGWGAAGGPDPGMMLLLDDITVNGSILATPTPEPAAPLLALVPLAAALPRRRRRRA